MAAPPDHRKTDARACRPAQPARTRGSSPRAGRRRQLRHDGRARQAHAAAAAGHVASGSRPNGARRGCAAPRSAPGRAACRAPARPSGPQPGRAAQTGADALPGSAGPGTRTKLLIETGHDSVLPADLLVPACAAGRRLKSLSAASPIRWARALDLRRPGRFRGTRGGSGADTLDPPCNPTPCPSPPVRPPGRLPPGRRKGRNSRALCALFFRRAVRGKAATGHEAPRLHEWNRDDERRAAGPPPGPGPGGAAARGRAGRRRAAGDPVGNFPTRSDQFTALLPR